MDPSKYDPVGRPVVCDHISTEGHLHQVLQQIHSRLEYSFSTTKPQYTETYKKKR